MTLRLGQVYRDQQHKNTQPGKERQMSYAIVDADGCFDSAGKNKSWIYATYCRQDEAIRAAQCMSQVQVIVCDYPRGATVFADAIGRTFKSVWQRGA